MTIANNNISLNIFILNAFVISSIKFKRYVLKFFLPRYYYSLPPPTDTKRNNENIQENITKSQH